MVYDRILYSVMSSHVYGSLTIFVVSWYGKSAFCCVYNIVPNVDSTDKILCTIIFSENQNKIVVMLNLMVCFVLFYKGIPLSYFCFVYAGGVTFFWLLEI
jgi:hypothetical protein